MVRFAGLAHDRERLDEEFVEFLALLETLFELARHGGEFLVGEALDLFFERIDERNDFREAADLLAFSGAEKLREDAHDGSVYVRV